MLIWSQPAAAVPIKLINKDHLQRALSSCSMGHAHKVRLWRCNVHHPSAQPSPMKKKSGMYIPHLPSYETELPLIDCHVKKVIIFNVYTPSSDADLSSFNECIHDLEEVNSVDYSTTAIVIAGDFNAHLGTLAGPRGSGIPNQRGFVLKDFIDRNNLFVASHSSISSGVSYTFYSAPLLTTSSQMGPPVDSSCMCFSDLLLNISDHVLLSISLKAAMSESSGQSVSTARIHWERAVSTGGVVDFARGVDECTSRYINSHFVDIDDLDKEVQSVCESVLSIANCILPFKSGGKKGSRNFFNDQQLHHLCRMSKASWSAWSSAGKPGNGSLFENKNADKRNVLTRLNQLRALKDCSHSESIDKMFKDKAKKRFHVPWQSPRGTRLFIDGNVVTSQAEVSAAWANDFEQLGSSKVPESPVLQQLQ